MDAQPRSVEEKPPPTDAEETFGYYVLETAQVHEWNGDLTGKFVFFVTKEK